MKNKTLCKRCKKNYWSKDAKLNIYPATSRRDNKTPICSECGTAEALFDFKMFNYVNSLWYIGGCGCVRLCDGHTFFGRISIKKTKEEESAWMDKK